ncbi:hypothetical protein L6R50_26975 [Myxococcota bacterium]|nr:hypothetical protein [Myxococcota bacterium]
MTPLPTLPHAAPGCGPSARASAPGKLLLFGEYAVLRGADAVCCAFDARIAATATALDAPVVEVDSPRVLREPLRAPVEALGGDAPPGLSFVWACLRSRFPFPWGSGVSLRVDAAFPRDWGLGSSSAVTVATLGALDALAGAPRDARAVAREAVARVRAVQGGVGSGADAATQAVGGLIRYRMAEEDGGAPEIEALPFPTAPGAPVLRAAYTGRKASTTAMVADLGRRRAPGDPLYDELGALAAAAADLLRAGRVADLGPLLDEGTRLHERLGTWPGDLSPALAAARRSPGVLGAKPTGAGGGDSVLLLAEDDATAARACAAAGLELLLARPDPEGLRHEDREER